MAIGRNFLYRNKEITINDNKEHTETTVIGIHAQVYKGKERKPCRKSVIKRLVKELPRRYRVAMRSKKQRSYSNKTRCIKS